MEQYKLRTNTTAGHSISHVFALMFAKRVKTLGGATAHAAVTILDVAVDMAKQQRISRVTAIRCNRYPNKPAPAARPIHSNLQRK